MSSSPVACRFTVLLPVYIGEAQAMTKTRRTTEFCGIVGQNI